MHESRVTLYVTGGHHFVVYYSFLFYCFITSLHGSRYLIGSSFQENCKNCLINCAQVPSTTECLSYVYLCALYYY